MNQKTILRLILHPSAFTFRYYQLTHDYLVHSLRDWLTRKQRETRRGRAELRLAERSSSGMPSPRTAICRPPWNGRTSGC